MNRPNRPIRPLPRRAGVSLIECSVVTAITAIVVGTALPGFQEARQRRQLEGIAAQLETDLQLARAEAVARNEGVRVAFSRGAHGSCYVMHTGAAGACSCTGGGAASCEPGAEPLRSVHLAADSPVQLRSNSGSLQFDAVKGTVTPTATLRAQSAIGSLHLVVNVMGRIRSCTPDAALPGYRRC
jgi:type IV fimbrial biogenesis protein FimT